VDLDLLDTGVAARCARWESAGLTWEIVRDDTQAKPASSLRAETASRVAELLLWVSGEADLIYAELQPRVTEPTVEHHEVRTVLGLNGLLDEFDHHIGLDL
jgi:hypothetical protein